MKKETGGIKDIAQLSNELWYIMVLQYSIKHNHNNFTSERLVSDMKQLSSSLTFFYKFVLIFVWLIGFGIGSRAVLLAGPDEPRWKMYMVAWLAITTFIFFSCSHIKKVAIQGKKLVVSNFFKTEEIDLSEIESVDGSSYLSPRQVWFTLKRPCTFGQKIVFIPVNRKARGIGKHPLVMELAKELDL